MAKQNINVGTTANDKKGDSLRAAFVKVNANFTELYSQVITGAVPTHSSGSVGDTKGKIAVDNNYLYVCVADYDDSTVIWKRIPWDDDSW
jgi:hypothetical protein